MSEAINMRKQIAMGKSPKTSSSSPKTPMKKGGKVSKTSKSNC